MLRDDRVSREFPILPLRYYNYFKGALNRSVELKEADVVDVAKTSETEGTSGKNVAIII